MRVVELKMIDLFDEEEKVIERNIDISNVMVNDTKAPLGFERDTLGTIDQQKKCIEQWITDRGNDQHNALLKLVSWKLS